MSDCLLLLVDRMLDIKMVYPGTSSSRGCWGYNGVPRDELFALRLDRPRRTDELFTGRLFKGRAVVDLLDSCRSLSFYISRCTFPPHVVSRTLVTPATLRRAARVYEIITHEMNIASATLRSNEQISTLTTVRFSRVAEPLRTNINLPYFAPRRKIKP